MSSKVTGLIENLMPCSESCFAKRKASCSSVNMWEPLLLVVASPTVNAGIGVLGGSFMLY